MYARSIFRFTSILIAAIIIIVNGSFSQQSVPLELEQRSNSGESEVLKYPFSLQSTSILSGGLCASTNLPIIPLFLISTIHQLNIDDLILRDSLINQCN